MAAQVGNLIRRLEELEKNNEPHRQISGDLYKIYLAFDRLQPFLSDAELKRDVSDKISSWVSQVCALAMEVEDIIVFYHVHLVNRDIGEGSFFAKLVYYIKELLSRAVDQHNVYAKAQSFISQQHSLQLVTPRRIDSTIDQLLHDFSTGETRYTWWQRRFEMDLVELMRWFYVAVTNQVENLNFEAWGMQLVRNTLPQVANSIVSNNFKKPNSSKAIQTILESINMVGRRKEAIQLENLLSTDKVHDLSRSVEVIIITGEPGVGKSSLAYVVYERVKRNFDCNAWVIVPPNCSTRKLMLVVLRATLKSMSAMVPSNIDEASESQLKEMIRRRLGGKKYLLVLDDVVAVQSLGHIKNVLPTDCRAKILCTSGTGLPDYDHVLELPRLSAQNAFNLLRKRAFLECDLSTFWSSIQFEAIEILKLCKGLPLAITMVAGMLSTKQMEVKEWNKVHHMLVKANFIGSSYADLRAILKSCFLYTASYTSDNFEVSCKKLQRLWIAEGFVQVLDDKMTPKEAAQLQLDELIQRNMIQVARVGIDGGVETCQVLSPLREFALRRCQQDQFCISLKSGESKNVPKRPRRLFFQGEVTDNANDLDNENMSQLYSFVVLKSNNHRFHFPTCINSKLLSVLELQQLPNDTLPDVIGDLCLLRYLGLRGTKLKTLPSSLKKLRGLQTLDIRDTLVTYMPICIEALRNLKHLLLAGSFSGKTVHLPLNIEVLIDLQTVTGLKLTEGIIKGLHQLLQLQKLSIGEVEKFNSKNLFNSVEKMKVLRSFTMKCASKKMIEIPTEIIAHSHTHRNLEKLRMGGRIENLLNWVSKLKALKYFYLWDSFLVEDPFLALENLPNLVVLSLCNAYDGKEIQFGSRGFLKLKKLSILYCNNLVNWNEIKGRTMENLQMLTIGYCPKLCKLPRGCEKITSLQAFQVSNMSKEFVEDVNNIRSVSASKFSLQIRETDRPAIIVDNPNNTSSMPRAKPIPVIIGKSNTKTEPSYKYMAPRSNLQRRKKASSSHSLAKLDF